MTVYSKHSQPPRPFAVINLADPTGTYKNNHTVYLYYIYHVAGVQVNGLSWNPVLPESFAVCLSNGSVSVWENQGTSMKCSTTLACEAASSLYSIHTVIYTTASET